MENKTEKKKGEKFTKVMEINVNLETKTEFGSKKYYFVATFPNGVKGTSRNALTEDEHSVILILGKGKTKFKGDVMEGQATSKKNGDFNAVRIDVPIDEDISLNFFLNGVSKKVYDKVYGSTKKQGGAK
ncbi:MAG: hypothetical protein FWE01_00800 [Firmicutes bacterium]|nr:hypothetical protein [Bacillota bacterium]